MQELQKTIQTEKELNTEAEERLRIQARIEKQEQILKENTRKHHFVVLKKQIEDRKRLKEIKEIEKKMERPNIEPRTPPDQPKFFIREGLKEQIKKNKIKTIETQKNELEMDRFMIKLAKASLDEDIRKKKEMKEIIYNDLKQSWENTISVNKLKKEADRLKFFGNISLRKNQRPNDYLISKSRSKDKSFRTPIITKKQSKSHIPHSESKVRQKLEMSPIKKTNISQNIISNSFDNSKNHKETLSSKIRTSSTSPKREEVLKRLEMINEQTEKIQKSKREILDYLTSRAKS